MAEICIKINGKICKFWFFSFLVNFELNFLKKGSSDFHENWATTVFQHVLLLFLKISQEKNSCFRFNTHESSSSTLIKMVIR
jgi:hypothetical protein